MHQFFVIHGELDRSVKLHRFLLGVQIQNVPQSIEISLREHGYCQIAGSQDNYSRRQSHIDRSRYLNINVH